MRFSKISQFPCYTVLVKHFLVKHLKQILGRRSGLQKNNQRRKEMHNLMELELLPEEPVITVSREVCKWTCSFTAL
ncbi:TPA: hypothetical protein V1G89_001355 [Streptococcus pneumoniae]|nr:hypothetical protein [Streptococcus pneumoniae]